jgi:hypothetical protein
VAIRVKRQQEVPHGKHATGDKNPAPDERGQTVLETGRS